MRGQYIFATLNVACLLGQLTAKNDAVSNEGALWNPIPGDECNLSNDQYLMVNAENQNTFLQCSPAQRRPIGVWKAMPCPPGQTFQFGRQMCDFDLPNFVVTARSSSESTKQKYKRANAAPPVIVPTHISYVNQPCNSSYCFGGSVCDEEAKLCKCPHGTTSTNGSLYCHAMVDKVTLDEHDPLNAANRMQNASPGSSCKNGEQCIGGSMCNPDNGVCTCGDGTVGHQGVCTPLATKHKDEANDWKVETKPSLYASPGEFCDKGQHCQGGSVCSSVTLRCACPMGTKQSGSRCVDAPPHKEVLAAVGDYCDVNTDCINGAYCHSGPGRPRCECLSTHVETDRICLKGSACCG
uniref:EGF-like domain-containing protein n=1 Tax=Trichuris muris TaxID=70415 RepID=A0A5S6QXH8_TRIMR